MLNVKLITGYTHCVYKNRHWCLLLLVMLLKSIGRWSQFVLMSSSVHTAILSDVKCECKPFRLDDLPKVHPQNQIWVYLQQESPLYTHENLKDYSGIFNWTMSYRRDSDIYHPYKRMHSIYSKDRTNESYNFNEIMKPKKKLVAWIVSNCQTEGKREDYVEELEKFISVDIYGSCGDYSCGQKGEACFEDIGQEYKFYLSFENSLCVDYITEKFYNALQYNLVPVVYGGGEYKSIAPPNSYINVNEYSSPMALAKYLIYLDKNPKAYLKYFEWKLKFKVHPGDGWCKLCSQLAIKQKQISDRKVHRKLWKWWKYADYKETENSQTEKADENERLSLQDTSNYAPACQSEIFINKTYVNFLVSVSSSFRQLKRWIRKTLI